MNRFRTSALASALVLSAGSALALPPIMDRVPANSAVVIVIPSLEQLEKDAARIAALIGQSAESPLSLKSMLSDELPGKIVAQLDEKGAIAFVMPSAPVKDAQGEQQEPKGAVLFGVKSYAEFVKAVGATTEGGVDKWTADGEDHFFRKVGDTLAATSNDKALLEAMDFSPGNSAKHAAFMGAHAARMADKSDMAIVIDVAKFQTVIDEGIKEMEGNLQDMAAMGGQAPNTAAVKWLVDNIVKQANSTTMLLDINDAGIALEMVGAFKPESKVASLGKLKGNTQALLNRVPAGPYIMALAADLSSAELRAFISDMPTGDGPGAKVQQVNNRLMLENATGVAAVLGVNPGGIMNGLLNRMVTYTAVKDPAAYLAASNLQMARAYEEDKLGKMTVKPAPNDIEGKKIFEYGITMTPIEGLPPQAMQFMFGMTGGPAGYMTTVDGAVVTTVGKSSELMSAAIKAANGDNAIGADKPLADAAKNLPPARFAEIYVGAKGIIDSVLPMAAMFTGMPISVDIPSNLPPVAIGMSPTQGNALQGTIFIPNQVLKVGGDIAKAFQDAQKNMEAPDEQPMDEKPANEGKPKF